MVRATTSLEPIRKDLKSLPGGWVVLRQMTYGEYLHRRDMAMGLSVQGDSLRQGTPDKINIDMLQTAVTQFEFKTCILDHNLEDENGVKLDLTSPAGLQRLDPLVGQEIEELLDELNKWDNPKSSEGVSTGGGAYNPVPEDSDSLTGAALGDGNSESMSGVSNTSW